MVFADGRLAHFDECQLANSGLALPLAKIALEMMETEAFSETNEILSLTHPEKWSPEMRNFVKIASWGTLKVVKDVSANLHSLPIRS